MMAVKYCTLDTLNITLKPPIQLSQLPNNWEYRSEFSNGSVKHTYFDQARKVNMIKLGNDADSLTTLSIALPRMIFPDNSYLLTEQEHVTTALEITRSMVSEVVDSEVVFSKITRADLVGHFHIHPDIVLGAHRFVKHPNLRHYPRIHRDGNLQYGTGKSKFLIRMYDQALKQTNCKGIYTRVEVQLNRLLAPSVFDNHSFNFEKGYASYRSILARFKCHFPKAVPSTHAERIALAEFRANKNGYSIIGDITAGLCGKQQRRTISAVSAHVLALSVGDWASHLPEVLSDDNWPFVQERRKVQTLCQTERRQ